MVPVSSNQSTSEFTYWMIFEDSSGHPSSFCFWAGRAPPPGAGGLVRWKVLSAGECRPAALRRQDLRCDHVHGGLRGSRVIRVGIRDPRRSLSSTAALVALPAAVQLLAAQVQKPQRSQDFPRWVLDTSSCIEVQKTFLLVSQCGVALKIHVDTLQSIRNRPGEVFRTPLWTSWLLCGCRRSTDVLEHVPEKLVPAVVQEFARVRRARRRWLGAIMY